MKRLCIIGCLLIFALPFAVIHDYSNANHSAAHHVRQFPVQPDNHYGNVPIYMLQPEKLSPFAWQLAPEKPIEERTDHNWGWWTIGVVVILALGMIAYVIIKRNPRKDA